MCCGHYVSAAVATTVVVLNADMAKLIEAREKARVKASAKAAAQTTEKMVKVEKEEKTQR